MELNTFLAELKNFAASHKLKVRLQSRDFSHPGWCDSFFFPVEGYIETARNGPTRISDLQWIDLGVVEWRHRGRLLSDLRIDHSLAVMDFFETLGVEGISVGSDFVRVEIQSGHDKDMQEKLEPNLILREPTAGSA